ncbi:MAG: hypothetical protein AUI54_01330 [Acidobacteria bacterium 13_1_40CM_2_56_5]|nr:MAG: hypothetical protein AUI54_01330 [Acidobacteria bacterium 13_1_40CM_2_56_5]
MSYVIAISGMPGAGKTTLGKALAKRLNAKFASFGEYVRAEANRLGLGDPSRADLQNLGLNLIKDPLKFCRGVLDASGYQRGDILIVDGIRHISALEALRSTVNDQEVKLIYVESPREVRIARLGNSESTAKVDTHPVESETELHVKAAADLLITAANPEDALEAALDWLKGSGYTNP